MFILRSFFVHEYNKIRSRTFAFKCIVVWSLSLIDCNSFTDWHGKTHLNKMTAIDRANGFFENVSCQTIYWLDFQNWWRVFFCCKYRIMSKRHRVFGFIWCQSEQLKMSHFSEMTIIYDICLFIVLNQ